MGCGKTATLAIFRQTGMVPEKKETQRKEHAQEGKRNPKGGSKKGITQPILHGPQAKTSPLCGLTMASLERTKGRREDGRNTKIHSSISQVNFQELKLRQK